MRINVGDTVELGENLIEGLRPNKYLRRVPSGRYTVITTYSSGELALCDGNMSWRVSEVNLLNVTSEVLPGFFSSYRSTPDTHPEVNEQLEETMLACRVAEEAKDKEEKPATVEISPDDAIEVVRRMLNRVSPVKPQATIRIDTETLKITTVRVPCSDREALERLIAAVQQYRQDVARLTSMYETASNSNTRLNEARLQVEAYQRHLVKLLTTSPYDGFEIEFRDDRQYVYAKDSSFLWSGSPGFNAVECAKQDAGLKGARNEIAKLKADLARQCALCHERSKRVAELEGKLDRFTSLMAEMSRVSGQPPE